MVAILVVTGTIKAHQEPPREKTDGDSAKVSIATNPGAGFELWKAEDGWRMVVLPP